MFVRIYFCIASAIQFIYIYSFKLMRFVIDIIATNSFRFTVCKNSKCKTVFIYESKPVLAEDTFLCPSCRVKIQSHHLVQCTNCNSIVNLIKADFNEEPVVFYVEKCSHCTGTKEDEKRITIPLYPNTLI